MIIIITSGLSPTILPTVTSEKKTQTRAADLKDFSFRLFIVCACLAWSNLRWLPSVLLLMLVWGVLGGVPAPRIQAC
ncbi:uncharacterized protein PHALS_01796 [Plasmopara halstedii]|uniref:Uncharacterized protein n=1 Tax=Plasmopara halstedii TaxID=4781 RepID=A0A0P1AXU1_PLAHL|nr:uncharacterized protein PHALS_01796 [Plasmopara halstedii]CEG45505.1 hypothetical protein PHALS_01796 [Plasmopara halstedii]|eukprot:XP_024581874.1 hypothetical protein PHALS_01796 [Plasmopara halstedii]